MPLHFQFPDDESPGTFGNDSHRRWGASSSSCTSSRSAAFCRAHESTTRPHRHRPSSRAHRRRRRRRRGRCPRRRGCCCQHVYPLLCFSLFLFLSFDKSARYAFFVSSSRGGKGGGLSRSIFFWICILDKIPKTMMMWTRGGAFSLFFFLREGESFIFPCWDRKKDTTGKERDLERETRRDCLKSYDVIVFFSFWITPSLSSPPL